MTDLTGSIAARPRKTLVGKTLKVAGETLTPGAIVTMTIGGCAMLMDTGDWVILLPSSGGDPFLPGHTLHGDTVIVEHVVPRAHLELEITP
jgi:hypothetical protein